MLPQVSIIVPVYNGEKTLSLCLGSLINLDYPKEQLEIIVVDNNSRDRSKDIIKRYPVKYLFEEKKGAAHAMNKGIQVSSGSLVGSIDQDCVADANWIKNMVNAFTSKDIGGCGGKVLAYNPTTFVERYIQENNNLFFNERSIQGDISPFPFIAGCNAMYRRDVFQKAGLFDPHMFLQDVDMSWRIFLMGYQIKYVSDALVYHKVRDDLISFFTRQFKIFFYKPFLFNKYRKILKNLINRYYIELYTKSCIGLFKKLCSLPKSLFIKNNKEIKIFSIVHITFVFAMLSGIFLGRIILFFKRRSILSMPVDLYSDLKHFHCF